MEEEGLEASYVISTAASKGPSVREPLVSTMSPLFEPLKTVKSTFDMMM